MKVLLADDHRLMLDGIRRALEEDGGFEIVGETQNGAQVLPLVGQTSPDLVVLDVRMPNMDGLQCLEEIRRRHPKVKVVMLSASTTPDLIEDALRRGASAYVLKTVDPTDLPSTLRQVIGGTVFSTVGATESGTPSGAKAA
ncbi:MAG TPA: response regulator transcription factor, partial [Gaiella sp.]|nr:response regulator transcription factor [Gaiella sp.]